MIYRAFVASRTRQAFADLSAGRVERHLKRFASEATLRIHDAATGGGVFGGGSLRDGLAMLYEAAPKHAFEVQDVWVRGWPGNTRVAAAWHDAARGTDGAPYPTVGMNRIRLRWGRVIEEDVFVFRKLG